jgi:signal transduction histidine kinase
MALAQLLDNAYEFSAGVEGPAIEVGFERLGEGDGAFFVRDNGAGFDPSDADHLFEPFRRFHSDERRGTGVGLAVVRRVIERHGGRVWAEGRPGAGACFRFILPRRA